MGPNDWAEITVPVIDFSTLQANSQLARNLNIPTDVLPVYAILAGLSENGPKMVSVTPLGAIRVAETGAGFTFMDPQETTVMNTTTVVTFNELCSSILLNIDAFQCTVQHSADGVNYDPAFTVLAGEKVSFDLITKSLKITNTSGTTATGIRAWGLYFGAEI
jgi:hypothetical protein